jgi:hypothetical protein
MKLTRLRYFQVWRNKFILARQCTAIALSFFESHGPKVVRVIFRNWQRYATVQKRKSAFLALVANHLRHEKLHRSFSFWLAYTRRQQTVAQRDDEVLHALQMRRISHVFVRWMEAFVVKKRIGDTIRSLKSIRDDRNLALTFGAWKQWSQR